MEKYSGFDGNQYSSDISHTLGQTKGDEPNDNIYGLSLYCNR